MSATKRKNAWVEGESRPRCACHGEPMNLNGKRGGFRCAVVDRKRSIERQRTYRKANHEADRERHRAYYEANRESILERARVYYEANREALRERQRAHYAANREAAAKRQRAYYEENREANLRRGQANRAAKERRHLDACVRLAKLEALAKSGSATDAERDVARRKASELQQRMIHARSRHKA